MADDDALPEAAERRLGSGGFSSGLSVPDFAACLAMGLRPVGLVQGFCVMKWSWYGAGSPYQQASSPYSAGGDGGAYAETYRCPHGFVSADHRAWGQNYEQTWVEAAWAQGFGSAYVRLVEEATAAGAHGVIGVVDRARHLTELGVTEFHILGTAVVVDGGSPPPGGRPWTTYLAGQRLAKLIEAGLMPVALAAAMSSVRVWAYCMTDYLMEGRNLSWGGAGAQEVDQVVRAHMAVRQLARSHVRGQLGSDSLHGARLTTSERRLGEGDEVIECILRGTRVRRFKDFDPVAPPMPTVSLS
ncbi:MAG TPA: hypothetical protein VMV22_03805 [Acidimicrobiales bacterium]|nr:hypothetical protein [Acidimicrobiales bacterium]